MRWLFLIAATLIGSACLVKKPKPNVLQLIERDTGILVEEDLECLPES